MLMPPLMPSASNPEPELEKSSGVLVSEQRVEACERPRHSASGELLPFVTARPHLANGDVFEGVNDPESAAPEADAPAGVMGPDGSAT
mmetsp:Transcript_43143/g.91986  ORF Transcript_43143/g.91986 Transcript_43143/m.91986 type:complete len:88 (-) Transcript_43143:129-392(-)